MHQRNFKLFLAVLALAVASWHQLAGTANVENLRHSRRGRRTTHWFEPGPFYLVGDLSHAR
jgi:hypothetical protein